MITVMSFAHFAVTAFHFQCLCSFLSGIFCCVQCFSHSLWLDDASVRNAKILFCKRFLLINLNNPPVKSKLKLLQNEMFSGLLGSDCRGFGLFACD